MDDDEAPRPGWKRAVAVVLGVALFLASALAVNWFVGRGDRAAQSRVNRYQAGRGGEAFVSREEQFRAIFPGSPTRSTRHPGGASTAITGYASGSNNAQFAVSTFPLAPEVAFDFDRAVNGITTGAKGRLVNSTPTTFEGDPAAECLISVGNAFLKALVVRAPSRVYQVQVLGRESPPRGYDRFKASFHIQR